jgi:hypothetical protein
VVFLRSPQTAFSWGKRQITIVAPVYIESENAIARIGSLESGDAKSGMIQPWAAYCAVTRRHSEDAGPIHSVFLEGSLIRLKPIHGECRS